MNKILTLTDTQTAEQYYAEKLWQSETLYLLMRRNADVTPNAFALSDPHKRITWAATAQWVDSVAASLKDAGLSTGDRVSIWLPNRIEAIIVFLACSRNGYICNTSLHQNYTAAEIVTLLESIKSKAVFYQVGYGADAKSADVLKKLTRVDSLYRIYSLHPPNQVASSLPYGVHEFPDASIATELTPPDANPDKVTYIAFTSGTTGLPKAVMHSDNTLLANARAMVEDWGHDEKTILCTLSPISHHIGTVALNQVLVAGCELVLYDPDEGYHYIDWIEKCAATYVMGVPTHAMDILAELQKRGSVQLGKVSIFYMAGAPIPHQTADRMLSMGITPQNVYGMTENGSHSYTLPGDSTAVITGTCGKSSRVYEVKIWNESNTDEEATPGEIGEIGGRGAMLMLGYFNNQLATESSFNTEGWFMSGDLGLIDQDGNLQVVGRKKDLIIRGGHNIYPARIEDLALRHKEIIKVAAVPVRDDRLGERVCLVVSVRGNAPQGEEVVDHLLAQGLSKYDLPEYYTVLDTFPLTASGKILKRVLVDQLNDGTVKASPINREGQKGSSV
ncbi:acyl--CoA ligase [Luminiphilus sp.]|nr:acyl--CoA ligase [Luminiphilus sp.]